MSDVHAHVGAFAVQVRFDRADPWRQVGEELDRFDDASERAGLLLRGGAHAVAIRQFEPRSSWPSDRIELVLR
jgi:hypothetical protein